MRIRSDPDLCTHPATVSVACPSYTKHSHEPEALQSAVAAAKLALHGTAAAAAPAAPPSAGRWRLKRSCPCCPVHAAALDLHTVCSRDRRQRCHCAGCGGRHDRAAAARSRQQQVHTSILLRQAHLAGIGILLKVASRRQEPAAPRRLDGARNIDSLMALLRDDFEQHAYFVTGAPRPSCCPTAPALVLD